MTSACLRKPWSVRAALHVLVAGVVLGLPWAGQAQTAVNVVSVAGGSSALLGEFSVLTFRQGPVPQVMDDAPFAITSLAGAHQYEPFEDRHPSGIAGAVATSSPPGGAAAWRERRAPAQSPGRLPARPCRRGPARNAGEVNGIAIDDNFAATRILNGQGTAA
jgi:hypothetical protein